MELQRYCEPTELNWHTLPGIIPLLSPDAAPTFTGISVSLTWHPDTRKHHTLEDAVEDVHAHGPPNVFVIHLHGSPPTRGLYVSSTTDSIWVSLDHALSPDEIDRVSEFLGLTPREPSRLAPDRPRTAFVAHRFDEPSTAMADRLGRFLMLLNFDVKTGRGYAPRSVAEKVRMRIEEQEVLIALRTPGEDDTWLIQESILAGVQGKALIVLKELSAEFKPGLLADHEYIAFQAPHIEQTFMPVLEGLRELGYAFGS